MNNKKIVDSTFQKVALLEKEVERIKVRNKRVEADKAWETSKTRTVFISVITFCLIYLFLVFVNTNSPLLNAVLAVVAYWVSTETYGLLKKWWLKKRI